MQLAHDRQLTGLSIRHTSRNNRYELRQHPTVHSGVAVVIGLDVRKDFFAKRWTYCANELRKARPYLESKVTCHDERTHDR